MEEMMKIIKRTKRLATTILFLLSFCLICVPASESATIVYFDGMGLPGIGAFQFDILNIDPAIDAFDDFTATLPAGWLDMTNSGSKTFNSFSFSGVDLPTGQVGYFNIDVELGNWVLGDQLANTLIEGVDFQVASIGTDYMVKAVPIPPALLLFGSGIIGVLGIRRRFNK
jgi:hypothetical protein